MIGPSEDEIRAELEKTGFSADGVVRAMESIRSPESIPREHRLRWVVARAGAEILEALDEQTCLRDDERSRIVEHVRRLQDTVDQVMMEGDDRG